MTREEKINYIQSIIKKYGKFNISEIDTNDCGSPQVNSMGSLIAYAEHFDQYGATCYIYNSCNDLLDTYFLEYSLLNDNTIDEIYQLVELWKDENI